MFSPNFNKRLIDIFNRIDPYLSQQVLPSFYSKGVQNKNTVPTNNKELVSRLRKIKVIVTNVLNDLGKPNNIQQPIKGDEPNNSEQQIKGGAEDDGLATLIVRVLKSISEKSPEETGESSFTDASGQVISSSQGSMFSSFSNPFARTSTDSTSQGTGTGTGTDETSDGSVWSESGNDETKNSLFGSLPKLSIPSISSVSFSKKDQLDSLLSDLIDIILNIANNEPLPLSMKDKLLSGLGKFSGIFKGVAPDISGMFKGIAPEEDTGVFVPVDDMGCKIGEDSNPIAKIGNKCIDDNIN